MLAKKIIRFWADAEPLLLERVMQHSDSIRWDGIVLYYAITSEPADWQKTICSRQGLSRAGPLDVPRFVAMKRDPVRDLNPSSHYGRKWRKVDVCRHDQVRTVQKRSKNYTESEADAPQISWEESGRYGAHADSEGSINFFCAVIANENGNAFFPADPPKRLGKGKRIRFDTAILGTN